MAELEGRPTAGLSFSRLETEGILAHFAGELDVASVESIRDDLDALLASAEEPLEVDLSRLTFMDSSGIAVLVRLSNHFSEMRVSNASSIVTRAIEVLGLSERLGLEAG